MLDLLLNSSIQLDLGSFVASLIVALVLSYLVKITYNKTAQTLSNRDYFSDTLVILALVTCVVITVVKFSLALSLGLVGALSIVRFRAAIKEPEELVFLFLAIGIGITTGANQLELAIIAAIFICAVAFAFKRIRAGHRKKALMDVNVAEIRLPRNGATLSSVIKQLEQYLSVAKVRSWTITENEQVFTVWFSFADGVDTGPLIETLSDNLGEGVEFSLTSQSGISE
jgi:hypothetical protein